MSITRRPLRVAIIVLSLVTVTAVTFATTWSERLSLFEPLEPSITLEPITSWAEDKLSPEVDATRILWSSPTGSAWLTTTNWTGSTVPTSAQIAQFGTNPTSGTTGVGINMNGSTNNGTNNQIIGAIEASSTRTAALLFGDSSSTVSGTLTLAGVTVNNVDNVILRNVGSQMMTIQNIQGSAGTRTMNIALGNSTENIINIDGPGGITISSIITGAGRHLTLASTSFDGNNPLTLSGVNTYSGNTTIKSGMLSLIGSGSIAQSPLIEIQGGGWLDVQSLTTALTLSSGQSLKASGSTSTGMVATSGTKGLTTASNSNIAFTAFNGTTPPLTISGSGTLALQSTNPVTVTVVNGGTPLGVGNYKLISKGATGTVTGLPTSLTVNGDGVTGTPSLLLTAGELFLHVEAASTDTTPPVISYTPLPPISVVASRNLTVTATDNVGVTDVRIVYESNGGLHSFATNFCPRIAATDTFDCGIDPAFGDPQTSPGTVSYFVFASDAAENLSTDPAGASQLPGPPTPGPRNMYTIGSGGTIDVSRLNTFEDLALNSGFTFNGDANVNGTLSLFGIGIFSTGGNILTVGCNGSIFGASGTGYIVGTVKKEFCGTGGFTFPIGTAADGNLAPEGDVLTEYTPVTANVTAVGIVPSSLSVQSFDSTLGPFNPATSLSRNWGLIETGDLTVDLTFAYQPGDVNGNENDYRVWRRPDNGPPVNMCPLAPCVNAGTDTSNVIVGVTEFSRWTLAENLVPTAANASLSGRVTTASGRGIRNVLVKIEGGGLRTPKIVTSSTFGNYRFDDLTVGQTYFVTVILKRYTFADPTRVITLNDNVSDYNFAADQEE